MCAAKGPDGKARNYAYDPNDGKFYWLDLKFFVGGKEVGAPGLSWSDAMAYDPELKLALINNSSAQKVWALKFDRKAAKLTEITE